VVIHHTFATYDGMLLAMSILDATGRLPRGLGDDRIFQVPGLRTVARRLGITAASREAGEEILQAGELLLVAPGGMWESLRPRTERRRSRWEGRKGFVRLALRTQAPLLLAACPAADDVYTLYPSRVTDVAYQRLHVPAPVVRGLGPTLIPRPVPLTCFLAPLLVPPPVDPDREEEQVDALHAEASLRMAGLLSSR
jgi:1-acyl-sn-glycerol-3-phosphate acyltransferase